jgi:hypothetical protein
MVRNVVKIITGQFVGDKGEHGVAGFHLGVLAFVMFKPTFQTEHVRIEFN